MVGLLQWGPNHDSGLDEKSGVGGALKQRVEHFITELCTLDTSNVVELHAAIVANIRDAEEVL